MSVLSILTGAAVLALAISQRRSPAMTASRFVSGIVIGAFAVVAGILGLIA